MCGRYYRQSDKQAIAEHFAANVYDFELQDSYNIAPQSTQPVVRVNHDSGEREVAMMRWGLVPFWSKNTPRLLDDQCKVRNDRDQRRLSRGLSGTVRCLVLRHHQRASTDAHSRSDAGDSAPTGLRAMARSLRPGAAARRSAQALRRRRDDRLEGWRGSRKCTQRLTRTASRVRMILDSDNRRDSSTVSSCCRNPET